MASEFATMVRYLTEEVKRATEMMLGIQKRQESGVRDMAEIKLRLEFLERRESERQTQRNENAKRGWKVFFIIVGGVSTVFFSLIAAYFAMKLGLRP